MRPPAIAELSHVSYEKRGHVAYVTLNRPDVLNAMNRRMHAELLTVWEEIEADDDVWVGVVAGAGDRAFSVGQDLKEVASRGDSHPDETSSFGSVGKPGWPRLTDRFDLSKPLVAQVQGFALGGGFELALACDLIVAADDAVFALPEARLGLIAGAGGVFRLPRQIPPRVAMGYLLTGRRMTADRAYELGLVNDVVPAADLPSCTERWLADLLRCAPLAVRAARQAAWRSLDVPLHEAFTRHYDLEERRRVSTDAREGPRAFAEKRPPRWCGR